MKFIKCLEPIILWQLPITNTVCELHYGDVTRRNRRRFWTSRRLIGAQIMPSLTAAAFLLPILVVTDPFAYWLYRKHALEKHEHIISWWPNWYVNRRHYH